MGKILSSSESRAWPIGAVSGAGIAAFLVPTVFENPDRASNEQQARAGEVKHIASSGPSSPVHTAEVFGTVIGLEAAAVIATAAVAARLRMRGAASA